jgi:hypothetical protein
MERVLLKPMVKKMKRSMGTKKVRGYFTNLFIPIIWLPIFNAMKQYRNIGGA